MKKVELDIAILTKDYLELKSSYKVAEKHKTSATAVKRLLKEAGVLRTQNVAASERNKNNPNCGKYVRTVEHKRNLSALAKERIKEKNPFFGKTHSEELKQKLREKAKTRTAQRNPNYKDGKYLRRPRDFKIAEFAKLRSLAFNRDKFSCFYCNSMGGHLHAHHIIPYWVKPEAFLDIKNLVTVCTNCHFTKAHMSNWQKFDTSLVTDFLLTRYSLCRERLNELTSS